MLTDSGTVMKLVHLTAKASRTAAPRASTLGAMDESSLDIRGFRWTGVKRGVMDIPKFRSLLGVMQIEDDIRRTEQRDHMLCQISDSIDAELSLAEQDGVGFRHAERSTHDCKIYIRDIIVQWRLCPGCLRSPVRLSTRSWRSLPLLERA
jgi:hypothetical protein